MYVRIVFDGKRTSKTKDSLSVRPESGVCAYGQVLLKVKSSKALSDVLKDHVSVNVMDKKKCIGFFHFDVDDFVDTMGEGVYNKKFQIRESVKYKSHKLYINLELKIVMETSKKNVETEHVEKIKTGALRKSLWNDVKHNSRRSSERHRRVPEEVADLIEKEATNEVEYKITLLNEEDELKNIIPLNSSHIPFIQPSFNSVERIRGHRKVKSYEENSFNEITQKSDRVEKGMKYIADNVITGDIYPENEIAYVCWLFILHWKSIDKCSSEVLSYVIHRFNETTLEKKVSKFSVLVNILYYFEKHRKLNDKFYLNFAQRIEKTCISAHNIIFNDLQNLLNPFMINIFTELWNYTIFNISYVEHLETISDFKKVLMEFLSRVQESMCLDLTKESLLKDCESVIKKAFHHTHYKLKSNYSKALLLKMMSSHMYEWYTSKYGQNYNVFGAIIESSNVLCFALKNEIFSVKDEIWPNLHPQDVKLLYESYEAGEDDPHPISPDLLKQLGQEEDLTTYTFVKEYPCLDPSNRTLDNTPVPDRVKHIPSLDFLNKPHFTDSDDEW